MISREIAAQVALEEERERGIGTEITQVLALSEICGAAPCIYGTDISNSWIAYVKMQRLCLQASTIIAVDRTTGKVIYWGSAGDEG